MGAVRQMGSSWLLRARWALVALLALCAAALFLSAHFLTDWMWFAHLGYQGLYVRPLVWWSGLGAAAFATAFAFLWLNLRLARQAALRGIGKFWAVSPQGAERRWFGRAAALLAFALALAFGWSAARHWDVVAKALNATAFGVADPVFQKDAGFYVFSLPALDFVQSFAFGLVLIAAVLAGVFYTAGGGFSLEGWRIRLAGRPRVHLSLLAAGLFALKAWDYFLAGYDTLQSARGAVYGASYADVYATLPATRILAALACLVAVGFVVNAFRPAGRLIAAGLVALAAASVLIGAVYPSLVQEYVVAPNELEKEIPFIENHIRLTRYAFNLDVVEERDFSPKPGLDRRTIAENPWIEENIRLWDWRALLDTYSQLQSLRPYYDFLDVDVDRYTVGGARRQVMLAARELTPSKLQNQSWVNVRMQYTHGYGVVMSPVNRVAPTGLPEFFIQNIPPAGAIEVARPQIYYGEHPGDYVVVKSKRPEFDHPAEDENVTTVYDGKGGVELSTYLHRLLFAARFRTTRLLLSKDITSESRVMLYRNVQERVRRLFPFLKYDSDPYPVVAGGRLLWMIDAYTTTDRFPYVESRPGWGNYARNAVKAVIDAYDGTVDFYVAQAEPVIETYAKIFPGTFKPLAEMPEPLREHVRYPEDLFWLQAEVLARYHMKNPAVFYNQEDVWQLPREVYEQRTVPMEPYYVMMKLPDADEEEFVLMLPFTPVGKVNLIGWLAARNDGDKYGKMLLYTFSKQESVFGPMQFEARIDQDTEISTQLTLWGQQGSRVIRGNLFIIPVGDRLLYVEPLYLQAEQSSMPEFKRVIVGTSDSLVMRETFAAALEALLSGEPAVEAAPGPEKAARPGQAAGGEPDPPAARQLASRAAGLFDRAQKSAAAGDWEEYGRALAELGQVVKELEAVLAGAPGAQE